MNFSANRTRRRPRENSVPMINVVFLLLVFFLITAQIAPPAPFDIDLPVADADAVEPADRPLFIASTGEIAFGEATGEAALIAAAGEGMLVIRADQGADANLVAEILRRLAEQGAAKATLLVEGR